MGNHENHIRQMIVYLVANERYRVLNLLNQYGVTVMAPGDNRQIVTAIYEGIGSNTGFRNALKTLMVTTAGGNTGVKKSINEFVKGGASIKSGFSNLDGETPNGWEPVDENLDPATPANSGTKSSFGDSQVGGFLNTLFSKENINKYIDTGITLAKNKQVIKANQQQIDAAAMELERQRVANLGNTPVAAKNNWVVPVVIVSVILVGIIVTVIIVKNKKA